MSFKDELAREYKDNYEAKCDRLANVALNELKVSCIKAAKESLKEASYFCSGDFDNCDVVSRIHAGVANWGLKSTHFPYNDRDDNYTQITVTGWASDSQKSG